MYKHEVSSHLDAIREEIKLIQNQELAYHKHKRHTFTQMIAHTLRESRLLEIHTKLQNLQKAA